jgi:heptosyltransferase II
LKKKVLIVKLGYVETIGNGDNSRIVSLGDIFRTTAILHLFKKDSVSWLTTKEGLPLLKYNPYINRLLVLNKKTEAKLKNEKFDIVINLEKENDICSFSDSLVAPKKYGFRFDEKNNMARAHKNSFELLANSQDGKLRREADKHWIELLYRMLRKKWKGEGYILGYKPKTKEVFDIGFNIKAGRKWKNKAWPMKNWQRLEAAAGKEYTVSYQESLNNIYGYIDWISSCRLLVTNDSLGLHLAVALKKKIIALFGPTSEKEVYLFKRGIALVPGEDIKCRPCFNTRCKYKRNCINDIKPETVYRYIGSMLNR